MGWLRRRGIDASCLCRVCATEGVRSPCVGTCALEAGTELCRGCGRTTDEIARWSMATSIERAEVQLRLRRSRCR
ncbi:MAG TPA: DUF1289 domain-containing protein [Planctomycetota bacterium]|nr:DUF1289 domain-containing protein [Planctomycetota bacterium]